MPVLPNPRPDVLQSRRVKAMHRLLLSLALGAAFASTAFAQTAATPDFSGTWKLNLAKSKLDKHNTISSETVTITSKDATIEFHYATDGKEHTHTYIADGKERRIAEVQGGYVVQKAAWKNNALVIEQSGRSDPSPGFGGTELWLTGERWTLSSDGHTLKLDSKGFDSQRRTFVYDKQ